MNKKNNNQREDPRVKDILKLLSVGVLLTASLVMPHIGYAIHEYDKYKAEQDKKEWEKYNLWRLRQAIKRLEKTKAIEVKDGYVIITNKGKQKLFHYDLEQIKLKKRTDGKWRLIIYDISELRRPKRDLFRKKIKELRLLQIQESVYITPFVCDDEIEYLRAMFNISRDVKVLKVSGLENAEEYKKYFGI